MAKVKANPKKPKPKKVFSLIVNGLQNWPLAPFLLAVIIVIQPYAFYMFEMPVSEAVPLVFFWLLVTTITLGFVKLIVKSWTLAAVLSTILLALANYFDFAVSRLFWLLPDKLNIPEPFAAVLFLIAGLALAASAGHLLNRRRISLKPLLLILNIAGLSIFTGNILYISVNAVQYRDLFAYKHETMDIELTAKPDAPDIYYLVFDRYASNDTLQSVYNYDNSDMDQALAERGFMVRPNTFSNYQFSGPSISSTLDLRYHEFSGLPEGLSGRTNQNIYRNIISHATATQALKKAGYEYWHNGSWWLVTRQHQLADEQHIKPFQLTLFGASSLLSEFTQLGLQGTVFDHLFKQPISLGEFKLFEYNAYDQHDLALSQFEFLDQAAGHQGAPKFVFGHFILPHPPYVFDRDGSRPAYDKDDNEIGGVTRTDKYLNQLVYTNKRILETIDYIKEHSSRDAVIILQPDEGPYPLDYDKTRDEKTAYLDWTKQNEQFYGIKFGISTAYHLPGQDGLPENITSVNSLRWVFNSYLGTDLPYLEPRAYVSSFDTPYDFKDITDKLPNSLKPDRQ